MPARTDEEILRLVRAARQGDAEAYGAVYERLASQVYRYIYAHLDERMDAEDLTAEIFLRVWQALPGYRESDVPFRGFLFRVARNALYDHFRRLRQRRHKTLDEERRAEHALNPPDELGLHLERQELRRLLSLLKEDQRSVLILRFLVGLSPAETGAAIGKSEGAVRVLQYRALAALRKLLSASQES